MSDLRRTARRFGLSLLIGVSGLMFGLSGPGWAQAYPPNGPDIPRSHSTKAKRELLAATAVNTSTQRI
jgi:hypothetical protein